MHGQPSQYGDADHSGRFGIEFTRSLSNEVTAYYDVEVAVPIDTPEAVIRQQAAKKVAAATEEVTPEQLTEVHQYLDGMTLRGDCRSDVPADLRSITFSESIRYDHDGVTCEGHLFELDSDADTTPPTVLVPAETIDGRTVDETVVHHVDVTDIAACLEEETSTE